MKALYDKDGVCQFADGLAISDSDVWLSYYCLSAESDEYFTDEWIADLVAQGYTVREVAVYEPATQVVIERERDELASELHRGQSGMVSEAAYIRLQTERDELRSQLPRWIPVSERLPDKSGWYPIRTNATPDDEWYPIRTNTAPEDEWYGGFYSKERNIWDTDFACVTHWIQLPEWRNDCTN